MKLKLNVKIFLKTSSSSKRKCQVI